jgi:hypothetical protein
MMSRTERIRELNDQCRSTLADCRIMVTRSVSALDGLDVVLRAVREFSAFDESNDPHHEHDFGNFMIDGHQLFWKFDYYDSDMQMASIDPSDDTITVRVLTIMLADEY